MKTDTLKSQSLSFITLGSSLLLMPHSMLMAAELEKKNITQTVSSEHVLNWAFGLVVVLALFFVCAWIMRKMGNFSISSREGMKVISALSLGVREKLILVQVGKKQLVLAVMPGKVDKLLVLEGEDQLLKEAESQAGSEFNQQLTKLMKGSADE
jgi:flagellar protein FliO/FliZ